MTLKVTDAHECREKPCELNYRAQNERASVVSVAARTGELHCRVTRSMQNFAVVAKCGYRYRTFQLVFHFTPVSRNVRLQKLANHDNLTRWHRGAVGRVSDSQSRGCGFESRPGTRHKNSGHVSHTCVPLFTKQYKLVPAKGR